MKKLLLFLIVCLNSFAFKMENVTYNKSLNDGYKEYKVYNDSLKKIRYKVSLLPAGDVDVTGDLDYYPKVLTIEPNSYQVLKIYGKSKKKLEEKEYPFYLSFNAITIPTLVKSDGKTTSGAGTMVIAPKIEMKGYGGNLDFQNKLNFENITFTKNSKGVLEVNGDIVNNSYGTVELGLNFHNEDRSVGNSKGLGAIGPHSRKNITIALPSFSSAGEVKTVTFYDDNFNELKVEKIENSKQG